MNEVANTWWNSLSINQMKEYHAKYIKFGDWYNPSNSSINDIWEKEGKPKPQELIPVTI